MEKNKVSLGKVLTSALASAVLPLMIAVLGPYEIFVNNKEEFLFVAGDFLPLSLLIFAAAFLLFFAVLLLLRGKAFLVALSLLTWLSVMSFLQGSFLNFGMDSLTSDGLDVAPSLWLLALNAAIWLAVGVGIVTAALKMKDKQLFRTLSVIALATVIGVQGINLVSSAFVSAANAEEETSANTEDERGNAILTDEGMFEVSEKGNVIVIVLDRFDVFYYDELVKKDADFFAPLDGFTYYDNNISLYSRTYPSIAYMLTGLEQDFEMRATEYFAKAYRSNTFFSDLKSNGYDIRLYTESYYAYRNASVLDGIAENVTKEWKYRISDPVRLTGKMLALSAYRYVPSALKQCINVSTSDFAGMTDAPIYVTDDAATYERFREEGVTVDREGNKRFTFIHLNGCHNPFTINEKGERVEDGAAMPAIRGVFGMIFEYFDELKKQGLYEDATIIITGDHARAISDKKDVAASRVTALFVKPSGSAGTALAYSSAPVCQENLRAEIVKSAGLVTENDYGPAFSDIAEDADIARKYCFERTLEDGTHQIVEYRVVGDANDFSNWSIVDRRDIGKLYK